MGRQLHGCPELVAGGDNQPQRQQATKPRRPTLHTTQKTAEIDLQIQLGRTRLTPDDLPTLRRGSVIVLDEASGEPAAIFAGSLPIGRGEIVVVDGKIGVRWSRTLWMPDTRVATVRRQDGPDPLRVAASFCTQTSNADSRGIALLATAPCK